MSEDHHPQPALEQAWRVLTSHGWDRTTGRCRVCDHDCPCDAAREAAADLEAHEAWHLLRPRRALGVAPRTAGEAVTAADLRVAEHRRRPAEAGTWWHRVAHPVW